ncbi:MAG: protein phosphatase 2C domain-containing protein [Chloroflexi bacterium]|nr:protein phosphatase 2C domain-containing protein [Chloroflexota bacterium]
MDVVNSASRWRVIRASVQGTSHAKTGQPCQDSTSVGKNVPAGFLVAAVADGAGSAELSADGSRIAACAATKRATGLLHYHVHPLYEGVLEEILRESVRAARKELEAESHRQKRPLRDFATTLIVAICAPEITGAAQIGDGAMITTGAGISEDDSGGYTLFSAPQRGEYANATNFITSDNWQDSLDTSMQYGGISRLAMFTDGIQSIALNATSGNAPHAPFFDPLFGWAEKQEDTDAAGNSLAAFLSSPRVAARADDDLTLLLAVRG